jgi:hypothetical protein
MPIPIIDSFKVNTSVPLDNRTIASSSTERDAIRYKYDGLKVFQVDSRKTYVWNQSKYNLTGITTSSWDLSDGSSSIKGVVSNSYVAKSDGSGLTNSSIISLPIVGGQLSQRIGIGGTPSDTFQIYSNYLTDLTPFVIHKSTFTGLGENWYYDYPLSSDKYFQSGFPSVVVTFNNGEFSVKNRTANSPDTTTTQFSISTNGIAKFNYYINLNGLSGEPTANNGSVYYDSVGLRVKVKEDDVWRNISRTYDVYMATLNQSGTSAPVSTALENTLGSASWSYSSTGTYYLDITGGFSGTVPNISGLCGKVGSNTTAVFYGSRINDNRFVIETYPISGTTSLSDNLLSGTYVEIKVWKNNNIIPP